jgi:hypothetical protein
MKKSQSSENGPKDWWVVDEGPVVAEKSAVEDYIIRKLRERAGNTSRGGARGVGQGPPSYFTF